MNFMSGPVFVDTNIFVYARDHSEPIKQPLAARWLERLWQEQTGRTSTQALSEYYAVVTQKLKPGLAAEEAWDDVKALFAWNPEPVDVALQLRARDIQRRHRLNWWDCLIVAAAQAQNCVLLLSEDMQDRATYGAVTVRNPFALGISEASEVYAARPEVTHQHRARGRPRQTRIASG
jgi:predicted nucleic acid-binding protein